MKHSMWVMQHMRGKKAAAENYFICVDPYAPCIGGGARVPNYARKALSSPEGGSRPACQRIARYLAAAGKLDANV